MYGCFERSRDALFNVCDALLSEPQACSLPELSLSPFFERRWPSVYEALQDGRIDIERLRRVFVQADRWMRGSTLCADLPRTELRGTDPYPPQPHIVPCSSPAHGQTRRALQTWAVVSRHPARDAGASRCRVGRGR